MLWLRTEFSRLSHKINLATSLCMLFRFSCIRAILYEISLSGLLFLIHKPILMFLFELAVRMEARVADADSVNTGHRSPVHNVGRMLQSEITTFKLSNIIYD